MRAPTKPKPTAADETARTLRIYRWLIEELSKPTDLDPDTTGASPDSIAATYVEGSMRILDVAERIAARTTD